MELLEIEKKRFDFLKRLYDLSGGSEHKFLSIWEIGDQLGFDRDLTISIAQYLKGEGLLEFRALGGIISITHYGNRQVEENLKRHVQATEQIPSNDKEIGRTDLSAGKEEDVLTHFWSKIEGIHIWKYYEIKACFIKYHESDSWKVTFLRIELLSEWREIRNIEIKRPRLILLRNIQKIDRLKEIFDGIRSKNIVSINSETGSLELFGGKYWYNVVTRNYAYEHYEIDYPCHTLGAVGIYPTELTDTQSVLKDILSLDNPPYFDLRHACKKELGIEHGTPAFGIFFAVLAPLYVRMQNEFDDKEIRLQIDNNTELKRQNIRLVLYGLDEQGQPTDFDWLLDLNGTIEKQTYSKRIEYNLPFASLNYKLYHNREIIEDNVIGKHTISITPGNWSKMLIERIDPDLQILESWIKGEGKDPEKNFERGLAILLHLCGFRTVHVGDQYEMATQKARVETYGKSTISIDVLTLSADNEIFVCQCTTEWKRNKVTELLDIIQELKNRLLQKDNKLKFNPVIFTKVERNMISQTAKEAEENNVKVVSVNDLLDLLEEIRSNKEPFKQAKILLSL